MSGGKPFWCCSLKKVWRVVWLGDLVALISPMLSDSGKVSRWIYRDPGIPANLLQILNYVMSSLVVTSTVSPCHTQGSHKGWTRCMDVGPWSSNCSVHILTPNKQRQFNFRKLWRKNVNGKEIKFEGPILLTVFDFQDNVCSCLDLSHLPAVSSLSFFNLCDLQTCRCWGSEGKTPYQWG